MAEETDVVVVGSGGAGLIAALHAAVRGARVVVLEVADMIGGTTAVSGGALWLPGNSLGRKQFGLDDSPTEAEAYLEFLSLGRAPNTIRAFVREAPNVYEFLAAQSSTEMEAPNIPDYYRGAPGSKSPGRCVTSGLFDTNRLGEYRELLRDTPRRYGLAAEQEADKIRGLDTHSMASVPGEREAKGVTVRGRALVGGLLEACLAKGVRIVTSVRATALIQDANGKVSGVKATREGKQEKYEAIQGVVLASGGFEWNRRLWDQVTGFPLDGAKSPPNSQGEGLRMALAVGARPAFLDQVWWSPGGMNVGEIYDDQPYFRAARGYDRPGAILVNRAGRRFMNENMPYYDSGRPMVAYDALTHSYPNYPSFAIMDREAYERAPLNTDVSSDTYPQSNWFAEAPRLQDLADRLGIDAVGLTDTVDEWNRNCDLGIDPAFHRGEFEFDLTREPWETFRNDTSSGLKNPLLEPIRKGPYVGVFNGVTCFGTKGGAVVDEDARVLDFDDRPIPGLFAAGNVTAAVLGPASPGGGSTLGPALTYGWIAGRTASA